MKGKSKDQLPFKPGEIATEGRQRDEYGRWLPGAKPDGQKPFELKEPEPEDLAQIRRLAASGHGGHSIAEHMGLSYNTWLKWRREYPEVKTAYHLGLETEEHLILGELLKILKEKGNPIPGIFLLKARHGYEEGRASAPDQRVQIQVTLPAALQQDQYQQLVEVKKLEGNKDDD